ncbi:hypothetical protein [Altererythrobacter sp. GH1-8]|uniref:hypothetical protein n=1 Tax=Altererythrobacter sp. GH1-8 TaxID=3349333 RepID=UPI00374CABC1
MTDFESVPIGNDNPCLSGISRFPFDFAIDRTGQDLLTLFEPFPQQAATDVAESIVQKCAKNPQAAREVTLLRHILR